MIRTGDHLQGVHLLVLLSAFRNRDLLQRQIQRISRLVYARDRKYLGSLPRQL